MLAHQLAIESDLITADMVEVTEFPYLGQKYQVMGRPANRHRRDRSTSRARCRNPG